MRGKSGREKGQKKRRCSENEKGMRRRKRTREKKVE